MHIYIYIYICIYIYIYGGGEGLPPKFSIRGGKYKCLEGTLHLFQFLYFIAKT